MEKLNEAISAGNSEPFTPRDARLLAMQGQVQYLQDKILNLCPVFSPCWRPSSKKFSDCSRNIWNVL